MKQTPVLFVDFDRVLHKLGEAELDEDFRLSESIKVRRWRTRRRDGDGGDGGQAR